jgi:hypothetical protein
MGRDESVRIIDVGLVVEIQLGPAVPSGMVSGDPNGGE